MVILFGNFLGKDDQWKSDSSKVFVDRQDILKFFKGFDIVVLDENKFYRDALKIKNKYWHIFDVIVKKK